MEWLTGLFTLLGVMLGLGFSEYRSRQERKERFRVMTFDKRLETHQQAYYWCQKLNEVLNASDKEEVHKTADKAREWWYNNCLFLDRESRSNMAGLTILAHSYANGLKSGEYVWDKLMATLRAIVVGIGFEYLPEELSKPEELDERM